MQTSSSVLKTPFHFGGHRKKQNCTALMEKKANFINAVEGEWFVVIIFILNQILDNLSSRKRKIVILDKLFFLSFHISIR